MQVRGEFHQSYRFGHIRLKGRISLSRIGFKASSPENTMCFIPEVDADQVTLGEDNPEVCKEVKVCAIRAEPHDRGTLHEEAFKRFSSWSSLRRAIATLITRAKSFKMSDTTNKTCKQEPEQCLSPEILAQATNIIIKTVQDEGFKGEVAAIARVKPQSEDGRNSIKERKRKLKQSHLYRLDPYVDDAGIVRVDGCLRWSNLSSKERHSVLLPKGHHVSRLLLSHYHQEVHHQECQILHGALRNAGYWLIGGHAAVAKLISSCVTCRKLFFF